MVDVPKVVGPDFPVQKAGAWSLGRVRACLVNTPQAVWRQFTDWGKSESWVYCRELQCFTPCVKRQLAHQGSTRRISLGDSVTHSWSRY